MYKRLFYNYFRASINKKKIAPKKGFRKKGGLNLLKTLFFCQINLVEHQIIGQNGLLCVVLRLPYLSNLRLTLGT